MSWGNLAIKNLLDKEKGSKSALVNSISNLMILIYYIMKIAFSKTNLCKTFNL